MVRRLAATIVVALIAGCGSSAMAHREHTRVVSVASGPACGPSAAHTLAADGVARVYSSGSSVFGCATGSRGAVRLGAAGPSCIRTSLVGSVRVAGRMAGLSLTSCGVDTGSTVVEVVRLSDGRRLVQRPATTRAGVEGHAEIGSLVLRASGAVAWIATERAIGPPHSLRQVERVDRGVFAVLDSGSAVVAASLRLSGSQLSWRHGALRRFSSLR